MRRKIAMAGCVALAVLGRDRIASAALLPKNFSVTAQPGQTVSVPTNVDYPEPGGPPVPNPGLCYISEIGGVGLVRNFYDSQHYAFDVTASPTVSAKGSVSCYLYSDFTNSPSQSLDAWTYPYRTELAPAADRICGLVMAGPFDHTNDGVEIYPWPASSGVGNSWFHRTWVGGQGAGASMIPDPSLTNPAIASRCHNFGAPAVGSDSFVLFSGEDTAYHGTLGTFMPRADENICVLMAVDGDGTSGSARLWVDDDPVTPIELHHWRLKLTGGIKRATANCYSLDMSGTCHGMEWTGNTNVCPTNISHHVCEVDSFCCQSQWDGQCVDEAVCAQTVCGMDRFCCDTEWDSLCDTEFQSSCM